MYVRLWHKFHKESLTAVASLLQLSKNIVMLFDHWPRVDERTVADGTGPFQICSQLKRTIDGLVLETVECKHAFEFLRDAMVDAYGCYLTIVQ